MKQSTIYAIIGTLAVLVILEGAWLYQTNVQLGITNKQLDDSYSSQETLVKDVNAIVNQINAYKSEVDQSMAWFQSNSILGSSSDAIAAKQALSNNCIQFSENECKIKAGCLFLVNSKLLNLEYIKDYLVSDKVDKLQSVEDFLKHGGGDCEDYSLFYKAEYNYMLKQCTDKGYTVNIESWRRDLDNTDKYWLNFDESWYVMEAEAVGLPLGSTYPVIVCGTMYNQIDDKTEGHCVVSFTAKKITDEDDILTQLDKAPLVEPQNGIYIGEINSGTSGTYLLTAENYKDKPDKIIYLVITDTDLFKFNEDRAEWISYSSFSYQLKEQSQEISSKVPSV